MDFCGRITEVGHGVLNRGEGLDRPIATFKFGINIAWFITTASAQS
jgi:hypothetical protein